MSLLAPLFLLGCGNDNKQLTPSDFTAEYAQRMCDGISAACLIPVTACTAGQLQARAVVNAADVAAGRSFMPDNAEICLAQVSAVYGKLTQQHLVALTADDLHSVDEACAEVYRGDRASTDPCIADEDCVTGLICDASKGTGTGRCGLKSMVLAGAGCANLGETCPTGYFCGSSNGVLICEGRPGLAELCDASTPCLETLRCSAGMCLAQLGLGELCAADQDCDTGFCEPYAHKCADDVRFAQGTPACIAMGGT